MRISAGEFRRLLARSLTHAISLVALSGVRMLTRCEAGELQITLDRIDGTPIRDDETLSMTTTDFLATGGDGFFAGANIDYEIGVPIRDAMAEMLRRRSGKLDPADRTLYDPANPRISLPAGNDMPVACPR